MATLVFISAEFEIPKCFIYPDAEFSLSFLSMLTTVLFHFRAWSLHALSDGRGDGLPTCQ